MAEPTWFHLTAKLAPTMPDLCREDTASWLWPRLRDAFPTSIATTLMPNHPHVLPATRDPDSALERLARLLGQLGRVHGVMGRASEAKIRAVEGVEALHRNVRYIALNPCRAGFANCPLAWRWSTHRDVVGACIDPWVTSDRLALALGHASEGFVEWFHRYVSSDPSAAVAGTPLPIAAASTRVPSVALHTIAEAVIAATRTSFAALGRRGLPRALFFALAFDQGWTQTDQLAELGRCRRRLVRELVVTIPARSLLVARLCLGDARLRVLAGRAPPNGNRMSFQPR